MNEQTDKPLIRWMKAHRKATRFIMIAACIIIFPLGGYFMIRDLTHAVAGHNRAQLFKFASLFAIATFGAIRSRAKFVKIVEERDRKVS